MVVATDRRLYISTDKGLFQARSNGRGYEPNPFETVSASGGWPRRESTK